MPRYQTVTATQGTAPSHSPPDCRYAPGINTARALGWFSIALGAAELLAPRAMSKATGVRNEGLLQVYGLRELITGIGILSTNRPAPWLWARVAGDGLDLATLSTAYAQGTDCEARAACFSAIAVAGVTAADVLTASALTTADSLQG